MQRSLQKAARRSSTKRSDLCQLRRGESQRHHKMLSASSHPLLSGFGSAIHKIVSCAVHIAICCMNFSAFCTVCTQQKWFVCHASSFSLEMPLVHRHLKVALQTSLRIAGTLSGFSSVGRASDCKSGCPEFDPQNPDRRYFFALMLSTASYNLMLSTSSYNGPRRPLVIRFRSLERTIRRLLSRRHCVSACFSTDELWQASLSRSVGVQ